MHRTDLLTWASQVVPVVKNLSAHAEDLRDAVLIPWVRKIPWRRTWQPTPVFLPGESHGQRGRPPSSIGSQRVSPHWVCVLAHACAHTHTPSSILAPGPSWWSCSLKGRWGVCPLPVSLVTDEPTWSQFPFPLEASLPATMFCPMCSPLHSGVSLQDLASDMSAPPSIKPLMSLSSTLGSFFGLEAGHTQTLEACGVQPNVTFLLTKKWSVVFCCGLCN